MKTAYSPAAFRSAADLLDKAIAMEEQALDLRIQAAKLAKTGHSVLARRSGPKRKVSASTKTKMAAAARARWARSRGEVAKSRRTVVRSKTEKSKA